MYRATEDAIAYRQEAATVDCARLLETPDLLEDLGRITNTAAAAQRITDGGLPGVTERVPLPSLLLIDEAWTNLMMSRTNPEKLAVIQRLLRASSVSLTDKPYLEAAVDTNIQVDSCAKAEMLFVLALEQLRGRPANQPIVHDLIRVYHHGDVPVLLRKRRDDSTALTLVPLQIGDMTIPRGSIVKPSPRMSTMKTGETSWNGTTPFTVESHELPSDEPILVGLGRVSCWGLDQPQDRAIFALVSSHELQRNKARLVANTTIEHYRACAALALQRCKAGTQTTLPLAS